MIWRNGCKRVNNIEENGMRYKYDIEICGDWIAFYLYTYSHVISQNFLLRWEIGGNGFYWDISNHHRLVSGSCVSNMWEETIIHAYVESLSLSVKCIHMNEWKAGIRYSPKCIKVRMGYTLDLHFLRQLSLKRHEIVY